MSEPMIYGSPKALTPIKEMPGIPYEYVFVYDYRKVSVLLARAREALDRLGSMLAEIVSPSQVQIQMTNHDYDFICKVLEELHDAK